MERKPWTLLDDKLLRRRLNKTLEEVFEVGEEIAMVLAFYDRGGKDGYCDLSEFEDEIGDLLAQLDMNRLVIKDGESRSIALGSGQAVLMHDVGLELPTNLILLQRYLTCFGRIATRCLNQGMDESDPRTGTPNEDELLGYMHDIERLIKEIVRRHELKAKRIGARRLYKRGRMLHWEKELSESRRSTAQMEIS